MTNRTSRLIPSARARAGWRGPASVAAEIVPLGQKAYRVEVDLMDDNGPGELAAEARSAMGTIDVLVNNAAMARTTGTRTLLELDDAVWTQTVAVNLTAVFKLCKELIAGMLEAGQGSISTSVRSRGRSRAPGSTETDMLILKTEG